MAIKINNDTVVDNSKNANVGVITATTYYGNGANLTGVGIGASSNASTTGIITATVLDGFIPITEKIIFTNTTINNGQENVGLATNLSINNGVTFTISDGTAIKMTDPSNLKVNTISDSSGSSGPIFENYVQFSSTGHIVLPKGTTAERPVGISTGGMRYNTSTNLVEYYNGTSWVGIGTFDPLGTRGVFGGGSPALNIIEYITINTTGNATDFGDLTVGRGGSLAACASFTRGIFGGGYDSPGTVSNIIDYITIATTGNALDFGDLTVARRSLAACSSSTRGVFGGGYNGVSVQNTMDYVTIATTGNATDFGDLTTSRRDLAACSSPTRGVFGGGYTPSLSSTMDFITFSSGGGSINYGNLVGGTRANLSACSSTTRGLFGGGNNPTASNIINYITIATTGNATDFGDLTVARGNLAACSSLLRGVFGGGNPLTNTIDYVTISSIGDATDFGDLTSTRRYLAGCSNKQF